LLEQAKAAARQRRRTVTSLIEEGLRLVLTNERPGRRAKIVLPVSRETGGVLPGVDLNNSAGLLDLMEDRR
jgi:hypothetical protein